MGDLRREVVSGFSILVSAKCFGSTLGSGDMFSEFGEKVRRVGETSGRRGKRWGKAVCVHARDGSRRVESGLMTFGRRRGSRSGGSLGASMGGAAGSGACAGGARRRSRKDGADERSGSRCAGRGWVGGDKGWNWS